MKTEPMGLLPSLSCGVCFKWWIGFYRPSVLGAGRGELLKKQVAWGAPDLSAGISGQPDSAGTGAVLLLRGRRLRIKRWLCSCVAGGYACPKLCSLYPCQADIPYKFCLTRRAI